MDLEKLILFAVSVHFFAGGAHTQIKFGIQIYHQNIHLFALSIRFLPRVFYKHLLFLIIFKTF